MRLPDFVPFRRPKDAGSVVIVERADIPVGDFEFLTKLSAAIGAASASKQLSSWRLDGVIMEKAEGGGYDYAGSLFHGGERVGFCAVSDGQAAITFYDDGRTHRAFEKLGRQLFPGRSGPFALVVQALFSRDSLTQPGPARQQLPAGAESPGISSEKGTDAVKAVGPGIDGV